MVLLNSTRGMQPHTSNTVVSTQLGNSTQVALAIVTYKIIVKREFYAVG